MRKISGLLGLLVLASFSPDLAPDAAGQAAYDKVMVPYFAQLSKACPQKHLIFLNPADLNDAVEEVLQRVLPKEKVEAANRLVGRDKNGAVRACMRPETVGVSCHNVKYIGAFETLGALDQFVAGLCSLPLRCSNDLKCIRS